MLGLGTLKAAPLPPAYGYDPDIRRLAVTTPSYSTAITQATDVGNGGAELSRLHRRQGRAAVGHRAATASRRPRFGLRLVAGSRTILETQPGFTRYSPTIGRLSATCGPAAAGSRASTARRAPAAVKRQVTVAHDFTPTTIHVRRRIVGARGLVAQMRFPAYHTATYDLIRGAAVTNVGLEPRARAAPPASRSCASA